MTGTQELIFSLFEAHERNNKPLQELAARAADLLDAESLTKRLDAFVQLFVWLREPDAEIVDPLTTEPTTVDMRNPAWKRECVWLSVVERSKEIGDRYRGAVATILSATDGVSLFADAGLPSDRGLMVETIDRFFRIVLPTPREETDLARVFLRLFPTQKEVDRFFSLPAELVDRITLLVAPDAESPAWKQPVESLLDAYCLLGARVQGLGLSEKMRMRSVRQSVQESAFYRMAKASDAVVGAVRSGEGVAEAAQGWKQVAAECREELRSIESHLETRGVNLDVVYAIDVIEKCLFRMEVIGGVLVAPAGRPKLVTGQRLMREVIRGRVGDRSMWNLMHNNFRLLAKKIVEWASKTGEHYITTNREEYRAMWKAAMGGGLLTVGTAAIKMIVTHLGLPPFSQGFLAGLNYAVSFVLMQNWHLVLATKQPSMTGAALAKLIGESQNDPKNYKIAIFAARILRSQLAAALGNIFAVFAGAVGFSLLWRVTFGHPFLSEEVATYAVTSLNPFHTGTIFYAMLTGVILWLSSLAGGWIENWAVYHQLPRAIAEHRLGAGIDPQKLGRWADKFAQNIAGWGGSIALGFMLGMTPEIGHFFGLPLDVRHVTLSMGTVSLGATSLRYEGLQGGMLLLALLGIVFTFFMNLGVSFYLAVSLALRAQDATAAEGRRIWGAIWNYFRLSPRAFFFPPAEKTVAGETQKPLDGESESKV